MLYSTTGEKYVVRYGIYATLSPLGEGRRGSLRLPRRVRVASLVKSGNPHPTLSQGERVIPPVADPNLTTQTKSLGTYRA